MKFRFAEPSDAEDFARWAAENADIPAKDIKAAQKENNPTATVLVIERAGKRLYVPVYCTLRIAYLGFEPQMEARDRLAAMSDMLNAVRAFAAQFGINCVDVLSMPEYGVARWASKHGFKGEDRLLYELKIK